MVGVGAGQVLQQERAGGRFRRAAAEAQQTPLCAFLSAPTFKREKPFREVLSKGQKKSFLKGAGSHFTHVVSTAFLASSFPRPLTSQPAWHGEIPSHFRSLGCTLERSPLTGCICKALKSSLFLLCSLLASSPRDHAGLSPEGAQKGDGTSPTPRHAQMQLPPLPTPQTKHLPYPGWERIS